MNAGTVGICADYEKKIRASVIDADGDFIPFGLADPSYFTAGEFFVQFRGNCV